MSLMQRVQVSETVPQNHVSYMRRDLEMLRTALQNELSIDEIAHMMVENPRRARNELKSACRHIFEDPLWEQVAPDQRSGLVEELIDEVFGYGPLESLLIDDSVTEIMVNGPYQVFFERKGVIQHATQCFESAEQLHALIDRILGPLGRRVDEASPLVNARLPQGHRVHVVIEPLALDGPVMTIRKFAQSVMTLADLMEAGSFDTTMH